MSTLPLPVKVIELGTSKKLSSVEKKIRAELFQLLKEDVEGDAVPQKLVNMCMQDPQLLQRIDKLIDL